MTDEQLREYKEFFTITKQEFSYFSQKMINKKHKFYTKHWLPPMYKEILNPTNKEWDLQRLQVCNGKPIHFRQNPIRDELKDRFKDNIKLQADIMKIIKMRVEDYAYKCWIIKVKTGMGKTHIIMDIIQFLQSPTLILVSNLKLMQEMIDKIEAMSNFKDSVGQYGGNKEEVKLITVMTKSSFLNCGIDVSDFDCIIVDELQTGFTPKFRDKMNEICKDKEIFLYWLSATPYTAELNESDMEKYYGKMIEIKKDYDFIPKFKFFNYQSLGDYEFEHYADLKQKLIDDPDRTIQQRESINSHLSSKCSLILCDRLEDIENWNNYYQVIDKFFTIKITGETKVSDDKINLEKALKQNKPIIIIWSIQKTSTGFDFPIIDTVFLFSSIKFESTVIQSVWRALRKSEWKTGAVVYVWNDKILDKQRVQKQKAIKEEYWVTQIETVYLNRERKKKGMTALVF